MTAQDVVMILVYTFPMFLFTVFPGLKLGEYLEEKYEIQEGQKRAVVIVTTVAGALILATFLQFA